MTHEVPESHLYIDEEAALQTRIDGPQVRPPLVIYFLKESFGLYPPCIAHVHLLRDAGASVTVIAGACPLEIAQGFEAAGVEVRIVGNRRLFPSLLGKLMSYVGYRHRALRAVRDIIGSEDAVVWYGTADTAIALIGALDGVSTVASVLELYDTYPAYRTALNYILPRCDVVLACEPTRAEIMQSWFHLSARPAVLPNKTYDHPRSRGLRPTTQGTAEAIGEMTAERSLIYQGLITSDRTLSPLAKAMRDMDDDRWWLYLLGPVRGHALEDVRQIYPRTKYLGLHTPPSHLEITSHASLGVAYYDRSSLNNIFCAPNKIYEYTGFGIPVLANDVSGLRSTIERSGAGIAVDFDDISAIQHAIELMDGDYLAFSKRASAFFDDVDNLAGINCVLDRVRGNESSAHT